MTVFVPESIHILGTDGGGLSVVLCSMYVDTLADLPAPTAYTGYRLSMGCTARVIADNSRHRINSAGQWVDITENNGEYTLPPATSNSLGGIMVGSGLTIDSAGMLSGDFSALWDSIYQTEKHLTGVPPLSFMASGNGIEAAVIYGNGQQTGTPTPDNPIQPEFVGVRTGNLWGEEGFSARSITSTHEHTDANTYGTTLSTTIGKEVIITQSAYPTGTSGYNNGFFFIDVDFSKYEIGDKVTISFDYICNEVHASESQVSTAIYAGKTNNEVSCALSSGNWSVSGRLTAVITIIADMYPYVEVRLCGNSITVKNIMLNTGTTPLPYEPYGWAEKITCAGQTVPVYLGEVPTVRRIKKVVFDGTESWAENTSGENTFRARLDLSQANVNSVEGYCSHLPFVATGISQDRPLAGCYNSAAFLRFDRNMVNNITEFKSYLAAQYAAGTPVTIWYVLATEQTGIINEPLCKIDSYADELHSTDAGISIQTVRGQNTLTIGTTLQPSKISITYF